MPVEFVNLTPNNAPGVGGGLLGDIDPAFIRRYARTIEDFGFDYTLIAYGSAGADQFVRAAAVVSATERLKPMVALRPNTSFPTVAAQALSTLDQLGQGRTAVHIISGGADAEQQRQGDYLDKAARYRRSGEFIEILRDVWTRTEPFSHHGEFYNFDDFGPGFSTYSGQPMPISLGGSSDEAYATGAAHADIFALWGEPLAQTKEQIDRVHAEAAAAGRTRDIGFWVTFRPVVAETDALAQAKARTIIAQFEEQYLALVRKARVQAENAPLPAHSQRIADLAADSETHDGGVLWTPKAFAGAGGASSLIVGSPETIAEALVKYTELGATVISLPTLGHLDEAIDAGRYIIPLVREELSRREAREPVAA